MPNVEFVDFVPVVINKKGEIPALESSSLKIRDVLFEYLSSKDISKKEIFDLLNVIGNKALKYKKRVYEPNTFCNILTRLDKEEQADILSVYMQDYLQNVNCILSKGKEQEETNVTFISTIADFKSKVKPLNNLKVAVIKHCNSNNTSMDISKKTGLKLSTVSTYLSRLRTQKIISDDRKPRLISDKIVIDLKNMEV